MWWKDTLLGIATLAFLLTIFSVRDLPEDTMRRRAWLSHNDSIYGLITICYIVFGICLIITGHYVILIVAALLPIFAYYIFRELSVNRIVKQQNKAFPKFQYKKKDARYIVKNYSRIRTI